MGVLILPAQRKILYYPTIIIPEQWLKTVVLYWDKVSSIVPRSFDFNNPPEFVSYNSQNHIEAMKLLEEYGIYEPTYPELPNDVKELFEREFFEIFKYNINIDNVWDNKHHSFTDANMVFCLIILPQNSKGHSKKWLISKHKFLLSCKIYKTLKEYNLIREYSEDGWLETKKDIALTYMSLLAKYHSDYDKDYTIPGTNSKYWEGMIYRYDSPIISNKNTPALDIVFNNILPTPKENVPIEKIIKFREKKKDELLEFRKLIDKIKNELSNIENPTEIKEISVKYREKIEKEVLKLKKRNEIWY